MRTTSITYTSVKQFPKALYHLTCSDELSFPITFTKTDTVLLPRSWKRARGASITSEHLLEPALYRVTLTFQLENFQSSLEKMSGPPSSEQLHLKCQTLDTCTMKDHVSMALISAFVRCVYHRIQS